MNKNEIDIELVKGWYEQAWTDYVIIDNEFHALRKGRDKLIAQLGGLEPLLTQENIDVEGLKKGITPSIDAESQTTELQTLPEAITEILKTSSSPLHYSAILTALKDKGYNIAGRDHRNTVLAHISRHK